MTHQIARVLVIGAAMVAAGSGRLSGQVAASGETADTLVRAAIRARIGNETADVTLVEVNASVPAGTRFKAVRLDPAAVLGKSIRATLVPVTGAPVLAALQVRVTVDHVVAARNIARAETLAQGDVVLRHEEVRGVPLRRLPRLAEVVGSRTLRPVPAGAIFLPGAVVLRRFVEPGDQVTAIARMGDAEVSATLVAADGGDPGDVIRVNNPESRRQIRARILSPGVVEVQHAR